MSPGQLRLDLRSAKAVGRQLVYAVSLQSRRTFALARRHATKLSTVPLPRPTPLAAHRVRCAKPCALPPCVPGVQPRRLGLAAPPCEPSFLPSTSSASTSN